MKVTIILFVVALGVCADFLSTVVSLSLGFTELNVLFPVLGLLIFPVSFIVWSSAALGFFYGCRLALSNAVRFWWMPSLVVSGGVWYFAVHNVLLVLGLLS